MEPVTERPLQAVMGEVQPADTSADWQGAPTGPESEDVAQAPGPLLVQRVARWLGLGSASRGERLAQLNEAIEGAPEIALNYVLRGELLLEMGEAVLAQADFQRGAELASEAYRQSAWGLIAQVTRDRAEAGLKQSARRLKRKSARLADA